MSPEDSTDLTGQPELQRPTPDTAVANFALLAFVATGFGAVLPIYGAVRQLLSLPGEHPVWAIPAILAGIFFVAIIPAFYLVLYLGADSFRFRDSLRLPALAAGALLTLITLLSTGVWLFRVLSNTDTVLAASPSPFTWNNFLSLLLDLSNLAPAPLLYAFFRGASNDSPAPSPYKPLRIVATSTVVVWTLWLAFLAIRMGFFPSIYPAIRDQALRLHRNVPTLLFMFADGFHQLIQQACIFAAPLLVWLSLRTKPAPPDSNLVVEEVATPDDAGLES